MYGLNLIGAHLNGYDTAYYLYNGHHDVTKLVSDTGQVLASYYYDAFGNIVEQTGEMDNPYTYAGYFFDKEVNLYYLNARYYDARIARFMTEDTYRGDPADALSLTLYTYCSNNPLVYWDPSGHVQSADIDFVKSTSKEHPYYDFIQEHGYHPNPEQIASGAVKPSSGGSSKSNGSSGGKSSSGGYGTSAYLDNLSFPGSKSSNALTGKLYNELPKQIKKTHKRPKPVTMELRDNKVTGGNRCESRE